MARLSTLLTFSEEKSPIRLGGCRFVGFPVSPGSGGREAPTLFEK
jgi:hypothetical protein